MVLRNMMRLYSSSLHFIHECKCCAISFDGTSCKQNRQWEGSSKIGWEEYCGKGAKREASPRQSELASAGLFVPTADLPSLDGQESLVYSGRTTVF